MKPNVAIFNTRHRQYLYDGNTGTIWAIDSLIAELVEEHWGQSSSDIVENLRDRFDEEAIYKALDRIEEAKEQGLFQGYPEELYLHPHINDMRYDLENNISGICLSVTQNCNLRCEYCAYSGLYKDDRKHSEKIMSFETARKAIDYTIKRAAAQKDFNISFYGGEPLLRFDLIKQCIEYVKREYPGKEIIFNMTTNGTLLDEIRSKYLAENEVLLHVSLDGPEEYHDEYRKLAGSGKGSFKLIKENLLRMKASYPDYYARCVTMGVTLSPYRSIERIEEFLWDSDIVDPNKYVRISRVNNGEQLSIYQHKKNRDNLVTAYSEELMLDVRYLHAMIQGNMEYLRKSKIPHALNENIEVFHKHKFRTRPQKKILPSGCCVPGSNKLYVSTEGDYYVCEKCNEGQDTLKIGHIDTGIDFEKTEGLIRDFFACNGEECLKCFAYMHCSVCPVQIEEGDSFSKKEKLRRCGNVRAKFIEELTYYLTILERNSGAFDGIFIG